MKTAHDLVTAAKVRAQEISVDQAEQAIRCLLYTSDAADE